MIKRCMSCLLLLLLACEQKVPSDEKLPDFSTDRLVENIKTLSSDDFEGRALFTAGEQKTIQFIKQRFIEAGLKPGNGESYFQEVSLVQMTNVDKSSMAILQNGNESELRYGEDVVYWSKHVAEEASITQSELVFVGFGIIAPEYGRNDYAGIDVKGKTVVMFINDPGYHTQDPEVFKGKAMTYYGRWTYKFEEAARQGAAGALLIHESGAAAYGWQVVQGWSRPQFSLLSEHRNLSRASIEGWVSNNTARSLFEKSGLDLDMALKDALSNDFKAIPLDGIKASASVKHQIVTSKSYNVLGRIQGSESPEEVVLFMGHWDHLGRNESLEGDKIFNGAVDNATGIASLIELAHAYSSMQSAPKRSIVLLAVTAEESGLLGSAYYAENPIYPLNKTIAAINIDAMHAIGRAKDVVVIGHGSSELEDYLHKHAKAQGRYVVPETTPEKGIFYRSDHFNFAKRGVPALYTDSGVDIVGKDKDYGNKMLDEYTQIRYHRPGDEYSDDWDVSGIMQDIELYFRLGQDLANTNDYPNWYEGNEFRAIRDQSLQ